MSFITNNTTSKGNCEFHKVWIGMLLNLILCITLVTAGIFLIVNHLEGPSDYLILGSISIVVGCSQIFPMIKKFL